MTKKEPVPSALEAFYLTQLCGGGTGLGWQQDFLRLDSESRPSESEVFYFNDLDMAYLKSNYLIKESKNRSLM